MYVVYSLVDPRDDSVHYVGVTNDVYERFLSHVQCGGGNFAKNAWVMELRAANKMVIMRTLEECEGRGYAEDREAYWIRHFQLLNQPLANISKTSSPGNAKKANLGVGRAISIELVNAALRSAEIARSARSEKHQVTPEIRSAVHRMRKDGKPHREIARCVGLSGRKYSLYKQVCREEGIDIERVEGEA